MGTTSSGAIDNIPEIQQIGRTNAIDLLSYSHILGNLVKTWQSLWVHIDAAWAGVALSCPENRERCYLKEINEFANSFCTNFHKVIHYLPLKSNSDKLIVGPC